MASLDEELQEQQETERERAENFAATQQQDQLQRQQAEAEQEQQEAQAIQHERTESGLKNVAQDQTKKVARQAIKKAIIATWPYWGSAFLILAGIALVLFVVIAVPVAVCNSSVFDSGSVSGAAATAGAKAIFTASGICKNLSVIPSQTIIVNPNAPRPPGGGLTDAEARRLLAQANICNYPLGFARVDCVNADEPQTSLNGIQQTTLNEIVRFKADCDIWAKNHGGGICEVAVSGGTETGGGHEGGPCSHLSGNKIDIRPTTLINRYITTAFQPAGSRSGDPQYKNPNTSIMYVNEGNHWDIGGVGCS